MISPIKSMTVTNHNGETLKLDCFRPAASGVYITDLHGLGAPDASINMTDSVIDGALYNSSRAQKRNITMTIQPLKPYFEQNRLKVYSAFPIKKKVRLLVETYTRLCYIDGYVESCDANVYSKWGRVTVSILCPNPYFREPGTTQSMYYRAAPAFHWPIGTVGNPGPYELGILSDNYQVINIDYEGDADTGIFLYLEMDGQVGGEITITNSSTHETMRIDTTRVAVMTGQALGAGDAIEISTFPGGKYINLIRNGETINLISALAKDSDWLSLTVGRNQFAYAATSGKENIVVRVEYAVAYVGV